jgi:hypothetical protein
LADGVSDVCAGVPVRVLGGRISPQGNGTFRVRTIPPIISGMRTLDLAMDRINAATADVAGASRRITTEVTTAAAAFTASTAVAVQALSRTTTAISLAMVIVAIVAVVALMKASKR